VTETTAYNLRFHTLHTLQMDAFNNLGFTPRKTTRVAEKLYSKGLISSPMTSCSHLPEKLRGHLQTVFGETNGYPWGDNEATLNNHAIITLRAGEDGMTASEVQLYNLIFNRMKAVVEQQPTRKIAVKEFTIGNAVFSHEWVLTGEAYDVTDAGTFDTTVKIEDAAAYPCDPATRMSTDLSNVMWSLTAHAEYVDDVMHTNVPFTKSTEDYGSVISSLVTKGLVSIEDNELYLTTEGQEIYDELSGSELSEVLLTWQFEANDLYEGDQTGRSVIDGFSNSLLCMVEMIDPDTED